METAQAKSNASQTPEQQVNIWEKPATPVNKPRSHCGWIILATVIVLIVTVLMKLGSMGWITVVMVWVPLRPILFLIAGTAFAFSRRKTATGYTLFILLCATSLLYALFFEDFGDTGPTSKLVSFANANISFGFLIANGILSIVVIIYSIVKSSKRSTTPLTGAIHP